MKRSYTNVGLPFGPRRSWSKSARTSLVTRPTLKKIASKILAMQRTLRAMRPEKKYHDSWVNAENLDGAIITPVHQIAQGADQFERIGNQIHADGLYFNWALVGDGKVDTQALVEVRFMIIQDTQQISDAGPSLADILEDHIVFPLTTPLKKTHLGRYRILYENRLPHQYAATTSGNERCYRDSGYLKLKSNMRYNGALNTDIQKNGIYLIWLVANYEDSQFVVLSGAANNRCMLQSYARLAFTDA